MATSAEVLIDAYERIQQVVHGAVDGLDESALTYRVDPAANSIAWLIWHLARVQDDHIADAAGVEQVWTAKAWYDRFGLSSGDLGIGYGDSAGEVARIQAPAEVLTGYFDAVHEQTLGFLRGLTDADLDRVVDTQWDPPVTLGVRLVSVISDDLQHAGQAAYVRGIILRTR
ncbi:putative damage-inducible protein DinB [Nocardia transvalensis]|uniref:Putative damage-inducible protein DinB n=1 Tax=Nocardia transvalensis TaxID=37333 RepID=A0A7W9PF82_9NOCA|nr:DinB family protein [Nocardia transvalensis]MBB5915084.1 putative damage-inducible protein DinB [Nocardia transvalensis]